MNDLSKYLGRGLLVLALSGSVFACGDDDDDPGDDDAGAGRGGSNAGRGGSGGSGGRGGSGGGGAGDGGMDVTEEECIEAVDDSSSGGVSDMCAECLCEDSPNEVAECDADCWGLISCFGTECADETPGTMAGTNCAIANCMDFLGGATAAMPVGEIIRGECEMECETGGVQDAGGDTDGGN